MAAGSSSESLKLTGSTLKLTGSTRRGSLLSHEVLNVTVACHELRLSQAHWQPEPGRLTVAGTRNTLGTTVEECMTLSRGIQY